MVRKKDCPAFAWGVILMLGFVLMLGLAGCGSSGNTETGDAADPAVTEEPLDDDALEEEDLKGADQFDPVKSGVTVESVFAGVERQPITDEDGDIITEEDTIWIYYSDGTFEQFVDLDGKTVLFSTGTYEFSEGGDFTYEEGASSNGKITIVRNKKYQSGLGLAPYHSSHTFDLGTLGFTQVYAPDPDRQVASIFFGNDMQPYAEETGDAGKIDTWWIYFNDGSFQQYAEVGEDAVLFSTGTYEFKEGSGFLYEAGEQVGANITIERNQKYQRGMGLNSYSASRTYDLSTLDYVQLLVIRD